MGGAPPTALVAVPGMSCSFTEGTEDPLPAEMGINHGRGREWSTATPCAR